MGNLHRTAAHEATAATALIAACVLSRADQFFDGDTSWMVFLVGSELAKALLCFALSWFLRTHKLFAYAGAVWFIIQAGIELFAKVGANEGYSAHGWWEWIALACLFTVTSLLHILYDRKS